MKKNFYGVAIMHPKNENNVGSLLRTAHLLNCDFICIIGKRYETQASDTSKIKQNVPFLEFESFDEFQKYRPSCELMAVELSPQASLLNTHYVHPRNAIYLLGAEDYGIPQKYLNKCNRIIQLYGEYSMNVAVAGSIVLYDRFVKNLNK